MRFRFLLLLCAVSLHAFGHDKSDVILLYNGDRITGEIQGMSTGELQINPSYAGTLSIEWHKIAKVDSKYNFEVQLTNAERLYGNLAQAENNGNLQFTSITESREIPLLDITEIRPIEENFADRLDYTIGASLQLEPELRTAAISGSITYEDVNGQTSATGSIEETTTLAPEADGSGYEVQGDPQSAARLTLERQSWTNRNDLYRTLTGNYELNEALSNLGRYSLGLGFGRYFIDTPGARLNAAAGLQGITEKKEELVSEIARLQSPVCEAGDAGTEGCAIDIVWEQSAEAFINTTLIMYSLTNMDMDIVLKGSLFPSLTESGRVRSTLSATVGWELVNDLYWTVDARADYDSGSPDVVTPRNDKLDYRILMGVSWRP